MSSTATAGAVAAGLVVGGIGGYLAGQSTAPGATDGAVAEPGILGRPLKIGIVAPGAANDYGWNQQGIEGLQKLKDTMGAEVTVLESMGYGPNAVSALETLASRDVDLIIAHAGGYLDDAFNVAQSEFSGRVLYAASGLLAWPEERKAQYLIPEKTTYYHLESQEASYLAGVAAALMSKSKVIGEIVSAEPVNWNIQTGGFIHGVHDTDPNASLLYSVVGSYEDATKGREMTLAQIAQEADVIFGQGDGTSFGYLQACSDEDKWFIDVIGDKRSVDQAGVLLTSVLIDFSVAYQRAAADIYNGTFGANPYPLTLSNGGSDLLTLNPAVPQSVVSQVEQAKQKILNGQIKVPRFLTAEEVKAALKDMFGLG